MVWISNLYLKKYYNYIASPASTSGLLFRRSMLSGLFLFSYSQIFLWLSLVIWVCKMEALFFFASLIWIGILTPFCLFLLLWFFALGLFGLKGHIMSFLFFVIPGSSVLLLCKIILLGFILSIGIFFVKIISRFILICIEHGVRFFLLFVYYLITFIYTVVKNEPILYFLYHLIIEIFAWGYVLFSYIIMKLSQNFFIKWLLIWYKAITFTIYFFIVSIYTLNKKDRNLFFTKRIGLEQKLSSILEKHSELLVNKLILYCMNKLNLKRSDMVHGSVMSIQRKKTREKALKLSKRYSNLKKYKDSTVDDMYKHFL